MNRQSGSLLIEVMIGLSVLLVGLLGFMTSFAANFSATSDVRDQDQARVAMENVTETLRSAPFTTLYQSYSGATFEAPYLEPPYGGYSNAFVQSTFYVNETVLPPQFGPILDIDGSGGLNSADCSTTYKILPVKLSLTYSTAGRNVTKDEYLVISP